MTSRFGLWLGNRRITQSVGDGEQVLRHCLPRCTRPEDLHLWSPRASRPSVPEPAVRTTRAVRPTWASRRSGSGRRGASRGSRASNRPPRGRSRPRAGLERAPQQGCTRGNAHGSDCDVCSHETAGPASPDWPRSRRNSWHFLARAESCAMTDSKNDVMSSLPALRASRTHWP